jgi:hypothetical protein
MNTCKVLQVTILVIFTVANVYGAADVKKKNVLSSSARRILGMMSIREGDLKVNSPKLFEGLSKSFVHVEGVSKDYDAAEQCFLEAQQSLIITIRNKACLYRAALLFLTGYGIEEKHQYAIQEAEKVFYSRRSVPRDRVRAYFLIDEILHTSVAEGKIDTIALRTYADAVSFTQICCAPVQVDTDSKMQLSNTSLEHNSTIRSREKLCCRHLLNELIYRIGRSFWYDGGDLKARCVHRTIMALNDLYAYRSLLGESLKKEVDVLRQQVALSLADKDTAPLRLIGVLDRQVSIPETESKSKISGVQDPFEGLYLEESSEGLPRSLSEPLSDDDQQ